MSIRGGRYQTLRRIASGGMARVYLARALGAGGFERLVALKALHDHLAEEQDFISMFLDEARLAARIRHPNVVGTLDVQQDEEGVFLVMDYVEGPTAATALREARRQKKRIPIDVALRVFLDALAGLHAAHELTDGRGEPLHLVHRDVSPENILIGVDGVARLTDFGVARATARLSTTRDGDVKGKGPYLAPEQVNAEEIDRRTDIYAAGAVMWELLAGDRLIRADNDGAIVMAVLQKEKPSPRTLNPDLPEALCAVCLRALEFAPADRFASAACFADAVEDAAKEAGVGIATSRAVAACVKELGAHEALAEQSASIPAVELLPADRKSASFRAFNEAADLAALNAVLESSPPRSSKAPGEPRSASRPSISEADISSQTGALVNATTPPAPVAPPRRTALYVAGGAAALLVAGLLVLRPGAPPAAASAPPPASVVPSPASVVPPALSAPSPAPAASAASSAEPAASAASSAEPAASASAAPSAEPAASSSAPAPAASSAPRVPPTAPRYKPHRPKYVPTEI